MKIDFATHFLKMKPYDRLIENLFYRVFTIPFQLLLIDSLWTIGGGYSVSIAIREKLTKTGDDDQ